MNKVLKELTSLQYWVLNFILFYSLALVSLPSMSAFYIIGDLGGGIATASYGVSFCVLGNLITKPLAIVIGKKTGRISLLKISLIATILSIIPTCFVQNYYIYLFLRFLTGICSGPIFTLVTNIIGICIPPPKKSSFIKAVLIFMITAPIISSSFGAVLAYHNHWRTCFITLIILGIPFLFLLFKLFKNLETELENDPFDYVGFISFFITLLGLGFCLITGEIIDGFRSTMFNLVLIGSIISLLFFIFWNKWQPYPILEFKLFKNLQFSFAIFQTFFIDLFYYAIIVLLSYWLHIYVNYTVNWIAFSMLLIVFGPIFVIFAFNLGDSRKKMGFFCIPIALLIFTSFFISNFNVEVNLSRIVICRIASGVAISLYYPLVVYLIMNSSSTKSFPKAFCFFAIARLFGSIVGISYFTTLWERRAVFYHSRLGGQLTQFSENTRVVLNKLNNFHFNPLMKDEGLSVALEKQARALALQDCYYFIGWMMVILFAIAVVYGIITKKQKESTQMEPLKT